VLLRTRGQAGDTGSHWCFPNKFGLKLEARKAPLDILVVDRTERPSDN
jgi:uncharacterized protein (TIGR03435 family)